MTKKYSRAWRPAVLVVLVALLAWPTAAASPPPSPARRPPDSPASVARAPSEADLRAIHDYIKRGWSTLTRSHADLPAAARDPKFAASGKAASPDQQPARWPVYISRRENLRAVEAILSGALSPAARATIDLRQLPARPGDITPPGLLYLPRPYVVPGGRFNEMYGWDSYFILRGLLRDGETQRARDLVDDFLYEVRHYGKVLNANRTYYLQRSQPPFLAAMVRAVYRVTHDRAWLAAAVPDLIAQHRYWTTGPHLAGNTGLSRYHALGNGPAPEVVASERDGEGRTHYDRVRAEFREHPPADLEVAKYYDRAHDRLTPLFYVADRTMRESGFDPSDRFGRFGAAILDYAPVCLNALLYAMEDDLAAIAVELGHPADARRWAGKATRRAQAIRRYLWDPEQLLYLDYDFVHGRRRPYPFATTFFPLWVGAAGATEAQQLAATALTLLSRPGGLVTSRKRTGNQWDAPYGWAPLQLAAAEGLRRYGLDADADALSVAFLTTVLKEFVEHGAIFEKYDVERRESDVTQGLRFGYSSNEIGFGWTNAAFLELEAALPPDRRGAIVSH